MTRRQRAVRLAAKLALAAALLALVVRQVLADAPGPSRWPVFRPERAALLVLAVAGVFASIFVASMRWRLLLAVQDIHVARWPLFRLALLAETFDVLIPGAFGGDLAKAVCLARAQAERKAAVLVSVAADRIVGFTVMALVSGVTLAGLWLTGNGPDRHLLTAAVSVAVVLAALAGVVALVTNRRVRQAPGLRQLVERVRLLRWLTGVGPAIGRYLRPGRYILGAVALSAAAQALYIGSVAALGATLGLAVPWHGYLLCIPLITMLSAVPLTPGSIGVLEELFIIYLAPWCSAAAAAVLALAVRAVMIVTALPGLAIVLGPGRIAIRERMSRSPADLEADPDAIVAPVAAGEAPAAAGPEGLS